MEETDKRQGGNITTNQINEYKKKRLEYMDQSIQMYYDFYTHGKSLRQIAKEYGFKSPETVRMRINSLIGEINKL